MGYVNIIRQSQEMKVLEKGCFQIDYHLIVSSSLASVR